MSSPIASRNLDSPIAFSSQGEIRFGVFMGAVANCALALPDNPFVINVCEDRYAFAVGFFAALIRGRTTILLPGPGEAIRRSIQSAYPDSYLLQEHDVQVGAEADAGAVSNAIRNLQQVPDQQVAAIVFTSGTTGLHKQIEKTWLSLRAGAEINSSYLQQYVPSGTSIIGTVPPWHMYGLEWSVMLPMVAELSCWQKSVLFPEDIRRALGAAKGPRLLLSTPLHLKALIESGLTLPKVDIVMSATSPLRAELAESIERVLGARVLEVYGCSEIGSMALRVPAADNAWKFYSELEVIRDKSTVSVKAAHTGRSVQLSDQLEFLSDGSFRITGRNDDLVKVAGKRGSLAHINQCLLSIDGVEDGVIYDAAQLGLADSGRLGAFVVAPELSIADVRAALRPLIDPAFMPRPLRIVDAIPRGATGKLRRADLIDLVARENGGVASHDN